jgi:hypothetical protein
MLPRYKTMSVAVPVMSDANAMLIASKVADGRADVLGAGAANTTALLQEGCGQTASLVANNERTSYHTQAQLDRTSHGLSAQNERGFFETRSLINGGFEATLIAGKEGEIATHKNAGDVKATVIEFGNAGIIESRRVKSELADLMGSFQLQSQATAGINATAIQLQAAAFAAASRLENDKQFALATLAASSNARDAALQLAECCCEIRESVAVSAKETQALIAAQESARIRDALAAANQENLVLRLSNRHCV